MFDPVHGSAPDIAGQGLANPMGAIGSAALILPDEASRVRAAIEVTTAAPILTSDFGGTAKTGDVVAAIIDNLGR